MKVFKVIADKSSIVLLIISVISLLSSMLIVVYNAVVRNFTDPIAGTSEIAGVLGLIAITFGLGYTQREKGNVGINVLTEKMPLLLKNICNLFVTILSLGFFMLVSIKLIEYGISLIENPAYLQTTGYSIYPFVLLMSIGFIGLVVQLLYQVVESAITLKVGETE